jgi:hypothetical protein
LLAIGPICHDLRRTDVTSVPVNLAAAHRGSAFTNV